MISFRWMAIASLVLLFTGAALTQPPGDIDFEKARRIRQKIQSGEAATAEEKAYLDRALKERQSKEKTGDAGILKGASLGLKPLTEMSSADRYKGEDGGLYGGGRNEPPAKHLEAALQAAQRIEPLGRDGEPNPNGKIVVISLGMSNTTMAFSTFMQLANRDAAKSPKVVLVDGAQGGMEAHAWAQPELVAKAGRPEPWGVLEQRLQQAGVSPQQVQVVWIKQARANPAALGAYPKHAQELAGRMRVILHRLTATYPNLQIAYLSSRTYAGHATGRLNPEPYAYESAFAVRKLILDQINRDRDLHFESDNGGKRSPLLLWGPYLWTDGDRPRKSDDLVWLLGDVAPDGTHPNPSGRKKVAEQLLRFFKTEPTAKTWFLR